jgi:hypothetical protein
MAVGAVRPRGTWSSIPTVRCQTVAKGQVGHRRPRICGSAYLQVMAEAGGFEPPRDARPLPVFKTGAFNQTRPHLQVRAV